MKINFHFGVSNIVIEFTIESFSLLALMFHEYFCTNRFHCTIFHDVPLKKVKILKWIKGEQIFLKYPKFF